MDWLLTGNGEMLVSSTEGTSRDDRAATEDSSDTALKEKIEELLNTTLAAYKEKIEELQYIIDLQKDYIDGNKNTIAQLEDFIKHLKAENHELKKARTSATELHAKSV
jgi:predicted RNase H-like nuclease (RuvC/YqgF family)